MFKFLATLIAVSLLIVNCSLLITPVSAHLFGQPPFFKVNGAYSNLYAVPLTSLSDFNLPQDQSPANYLVNQPINFEFDVSRLPAPADVVKKTQFTWDYGDGSKGEGLKNTHTYTKIGSYFLTVDAFDGTTPQPQLLESVLVNVLPDNSYQLPKAVIKVNGQGSSDPLTDIKVFPFDQNIQLDGTASTANSSKVVSYFWDFGDQQSSTDPSPTHFYPGNQTQIFPVLRVKDANGFIADSYLEIENQKNVAVKGTNPIDTQKANAPKQGLGAKSESQLPKVLAVLFGFLVVGFMVQRFARGRGRGRRQ